MISYLWVDVNSNLIKNLFTSSSVSSSYSKASSMASPINSDTTSIFSFCLSNSSIILCPFHGNMIPLAKGSAKKKKKILSQNIIPLCILCYFMNETCFYCVIFLYSFLHNKFVFLLFNFPPTKQDNYDSVELLNNGILFSLFFYFLFSIYPNPIPRSLIYLFFFSSDPNSIP